MPPDFHTTSPVSSLFGSQDASEDEEAEDKTRTDGFKPGQSPTETLRDVLRNGSSRLDGSKRHEADRTRWKTLRDFVDERAIEDKLDDIDSERGVLDVRVSLALYDSNIAHFCNRISLLRRPIFLILCKEQYLQSTCLSRER